MQPRRRDCGAQKKKTRPSGPPLKYFRTMPDSREITAVENVSMQFGATCALDNVSISFRGGECHGVIGENGAGKSTLMKILAGVQRPTSGIVRYRREIVHFHGVADAQRRGISMIHQELNLIDHLSVAANIFLGREPTKFGLLNRTAIHEQSRRLLMRLLPEIDPTAAVGGLSIAHKQMVEIAKALSLRASVLIMDEPTAVLTRRETAKLFDAIARLRDEGAAVIYISHVLPEVLKVCDRITVLRDGAVAAALAPVDVQHATEQHLASLMVGRSLASFFPPSIATPGATVLEISNVRVPRLRSESMGNTGDRVNDVSLTLRAGEILGMAGLIGAGRTELCEAIVGFRKRLGEVKLLGKRILPANPRAALAAGIAYLPEDRKATGLALNLDLISNTTLVSLRRYSRLLLRTRLMRMATQRHVKQMRIRAGNLRQSVGTLSGGNQQKIALAKWLETEPKLLILDEPTRGVDVGARLEIYRLIRDLTSRGMACILVSSELTEVLGMSDRIAVMRGGQLAATLDAATLTRGGHAVAEEIIMQHAAGVAPVGA
jgi:ribose transport system ATP-binding protein